MSRDWTPREHYFADLTIEKMGKESFRKSFLNMTFQYGKDKPEPLYSKDEKEFLSKFKELGFLFTSGMTKLHKSTSAHPIRRNRILMEIEKELEKIIDIDVNGGSTDDCNKMVFKWYLGELDEDFYYSDRNNNVFMQYLYDRIMEVDKKNNS